MRRTDLTHEFVDFVPEEMEEGRLYVSMEYATAVHNCACGCSRRVVTPISPAQWKLIFDGESVSLMPSIGNWQFPCRSHYWIRTNQVCWAVPWTDAEIAAGHREDRLDLERHFARPEVEGSVPTKEPVGRRRGLRERLGLWRQGTK